MYKNNSGLIAKTKVSKYKKGLCLTEKLVLQNPLLFLYYTLETILNHNMAKNKLEKGNHLKLHTENT
jgi:hypothetical protein